MKSLFAAQFLGLWYWKTLGLLAANLFVYAGAIWGLLRVKPWKALKGADEPSSPATRRTDKLFGLSGLFAMLGVLALILGTNDEDDPFGGVVAQPGIAWHGDLRDRELSASMAIAWWWYYSADEHERRANDVGFLAGGGLFLTVTPVWWIAARAGLLPPPDAMILWHATVVMMGIG